MSRLRNGLILTAMLTLLVSGCGETMPVAMFIAENPPAKPGQKPVDDTDSIRPFPFGVVLDTAEAESSVLSEPALTSRRLSTPPSTGSALSSRRPVIASHPLLGRCRSFFCSAIVPVSVL